MQDLELKNKILDEIMGMMDEKDGERLKSHPKFAAKAALAEPEPEIEAEEEALKPEGEISEDEMSPEMIQKMLEMYKDLK